MKSKLYTWGSSAPNYFKNAYLNRCNSAADCSILLQFSATFDHMTH